jgi:hypothetical protein
MNLSVWRLLAGGGGCLLLLLTSGLVVNGVLSAISRKPMQDLVEKNKRDTGFVVGKCENILIFVFMLASAYTALGLVFTAKTVVRLEDARREPLFYLAGTMVNVTYSVLVALLVKLLFRVLP